MNTVLYLLHTGQTVYSKISLPKIGVQICMPFHSHLQTANNIQHMPYNTDLLTSLNILWLLSAGAKTHLKFCSIQMSNAGEDKILLQLS
jgi:hypothetical protein